MIAMLEAIKRIEINGSLIARNAVLNLIGQAVPMIVELKQQVGLQARCRRFRARSKDNTWMHISANYRKAGLSRIFGIGEAYFFAVITNLLIHMDAPTWITAGGCMEIEK